MHAWCACSFVRSYVCLSFYLFKYLSHSHAMLIDSYKLTANQAIATNSHTHMHAQTHTRVHLAKMPCDKHNTYGKKHMSKKWFAFLVVDCRSSSTMLLLLFSFHTLKETIRWNFARWHAPFTYKIQIYTYTPSLVAFDFAFTNGLTISSVPPYNLDNAKREGKSNGWSDTCECVLLFPSAVDGVSIVGDLCRFSWVHLFVWCEFMWVNVLFWLINIVDP